MVKINPVFFFPAFVFQRKYVLMMVDPDAPSHSNPVRSHWRHWLIADIKVKTDFYPQKGLHWVSFSR